MSKQKPERVFRIGNVSSAVFVNTSSREDQGEIVERDFRTVTLQRSYLDNKDERQYANNFTLGDLPNAIRVLQLAMAHVETEEAQVVG
jgi:hypothetical protein